MGSHKGRHRVQPAEGAAPELAPVAQLFSLGLFTHQRCWGSSQWVPSHHPHPRAVCGPSDKGPKGFVNYNRWTRLLKDDMLTNSMVSITFWEIFSTLLTLARLSAPLLMSWKSCQLFKASIKHIQLSFDSLVSCLYPRGKKVLQNMSW